MSKVARQGLSVWKIFLKNKVASSVMMLLTGIMMFFAALNGHGNDTKTLPIIITIIGVTLTSYMFYKIGYLKSDLDKNGQSKGALFAQIVEALLYVVVVGLGVFLLTNESFTNQVLNLLAGGFTTFNGILNAIKTYRNRINKDFYWKLMLVLMVFELAIGPYFIFNSSSININWYIIMGALTIVAGIIEVISAMTRDNLKSTMNDGRKIVQIIKNKDHDKSE